MHILEMAFIENMMLILLDERRVNASLNILTQTGNCTLNFIPLEWVNVSVKAVVSTLIFMRFCFCSVVAALSALYKNR
jgi:hypothetical protein